MKRLTSLCVLLLVLCISVVAKNYKVVPVKL